MKKYLCPLCQKESAYVSEYGLADSVICKCKGLNEVGRLVNGIYQPMGVKTSSNDVVNKAMDFHINQSLPRGQSNTQGMSANRVSRGLQVGDYIIQQLQTEAEILQAGQQFQNALSVPSQVQSYLSRGTIWVAEHQTDSEKSIIFFIDNSKQLQNFYLKRNASPDPKERQVVVEALQKNNLIN